MSVCFLNPKIQLKRERKISTECLTSILAPQFSGVIYKMVKAFYSHLVKYLVESSKSIFRGDLGFFPMM